MKRKFKPHLIAGGAIGVGMSWVFSSHRSPIKRRMPNSRLKNFNFLPNLIIEREKHHYHIHHWFYLIFVYISFVFIPKEIPGKVFAQSFIAGCIVHGLTYDDRFLFRKNKNRFRFF